MRNRCYKKYSGRAEERRRKKIVEDQQEQERYLKRGIEKKKVLRGSRADKEKENIGNAGGRRRIVEV